MERKNPHNTQKLLCVFIFFKVYFCSPKFVNAHGVHLTPFNRTYLLPLTISPLGSKQGGNLFGDHALVCHHPTTPVLSIQQSSVHGFICPAISAPGSDYLFVWANAPVLLP
jgi:hypothetical protein